MILILINLLLTFKIYKTPVNAPSLNTFKKNILKLIRPTANNIFSCQNLQGIQYLTHFMPLVSFDTPWKHQKNQRFSNVFRGYRKRPVAWNGLTRLRLGLSHLREQKFKNNFQDTLNPLCTCGWEVENICHFFLHCLISLLKETLFSKKLLILIVIFFMKLTLRHLYLVTQSTPMKSICKFWMLASTLS